MNDFSGLISDFQTFGQAERGAGISNNLKSAGFKLILGLSSECNI